MIRISLVLYFFVFFMNDVYGQNEIKDTLYYEGSGKKYKVFVLSDSHRDIQKMNFWLGGIVGADRTSFGGISYYQPDKFLINSYFGLGAGIDGNYFVKSWTKDKTMSQSIDFSNNGLPTKYVAKLPIKKGFSIGPHLGLSHFKQQVYQSQNFEHWASSAAAGFTFLRVKHGHYGISSKYASRRGHKIVALHTDFLWFFNHSYPGSHSNYTQEEYLAINESNTNDFGFRIYIDGNTTIWNKKGSFGFKYHIGFTVPADKRDMFGDEVIGMTGGVGFSWSFN
ncbi:MAG: hypothetical protein ABJG99_01210 [Crocinitomicaceae bacterium]